MSESFWIGLIIGVLSFAGIIALARYRDRRVSDGQLNTEIRFACPDCQVKRTVVNPANMASVPDCPFCDHPMTPY